MAPAAVCKAQLGYPLKSIGEWQAFVGGVKFRR